jgi:hypothetical protein
MGQAQVTKRLTRSTSSIQPFPRLKKKGLCKETNTKTFAANGEYFKEELIEKELTDLHPCTRQSCHHLQVLVCHSSTSSNICWHLFT